MWCVVLSSLGFYSTISDFVPPHTHMGSTPLPFLLLLSIISLFYYLLPHAHSFHLFSYFIFHLCSLLARFSSVHSVSVAPRLLECTQDDPSTSISLSHSLAHSSFLHIYMLLVLLLCFFCFLVFFVFSFSHLSFLYTSWLYARLHFFSDPIRLYSYISIHLCLLSQLHRSRRSIDACAASTLKYFESRARMRIFSPFFAHLSSNSHIIGLCCFLKLHCS